VTEGFSAETALDGGDEMGLGTAIGVLIRAAREKAGLTQEALGEKLGVTQAAISYWEAARTDPGAVGIVSLAVALGVTPASLLPAVETAVPEPPLPPGEYARVEIMGHDYHTGWVTERDRAGVRVLVIADWDSRVLAEIPGQSLYRYVPLPTPLKRPDERAAIEAPGGSDDYLWDQEGLA
jgi:transcriptional regulator with XRE-family HTH domain